MSGCPQLWATGTGAAAGHAVQPAHDAHRILSPRDNRLRRAMLFRRRKPLSLAGRLRTMIWPAKGHRRPWRYLLLRVLRIRATPHSIAAGLSAGIFASFTPFIGLHFLLALALAFACGGNLLAAALGTAVGNPLTFPLVWAASFRLGTMMIGQGIPQHTAGPDLFALFEHMDVAALWEPVLKPMLVGGTALGLIAALPAYAIIRIAVARFQRRSSATTRSVRQS